MKSIRHLHRAPWLGLGLLALFAMAASSPECARSTDDAVGPGFAPAAADPLAACERDCRADYREGLRAERRRHRITLRACNGDVECQAAEEAMHQTILAELEADLAGCVAACQHQQGLGGGGQ